MKASTKATLEVIMEECDQDDKSTEYMIARMMDGTGLEHEEVMDYLISISLAEEE